MGPQSVSKDNSDAESTGHALDPQQSCEQRNEKMPSIAGKSASSGERSPVNDVEKAMSEDDAAVDADPISPFSRHKLDPENEIGQAASEDDVAILKNFHLHFAAARMT